MAGLHPPPQGFDLVRIIHSLRSFITFTGQTFLRNVEVFHPLSINIDARIPIVTKNHSMNVVYLIKMSCAVPEKVILEIQKCIILCANCHRKVTHKKLNVSNWQTCQIDKNDSIYLYYLEKFGKATRIFK